MPSETPTRPVTVEACRSWVVTLRATAWLIPADLAPPLTAVADEITRAIDATAPAPMLQFTTTRPAYRSRVPHFVDWPTYELTRMAVEVGQVCRRLAPELWEQRDELVAVTSSMFKWRGPIATTVEVSA